jgi:formylglycine-generating enzyme required for sulfatase activity
MDSSDEARAVVASDVGHPLPDLGSPHSEAARLVKHASPARLAVRLLLTATVLGGAAGGAWLGHAAWRVRLAKHARMAHVPGVTARIGNAAGPPEEQPEHDVTLRPFEIDVTEVTVAAYAACVRELRCKPPQKGDFCNWAKDGLDEHPINCVDHEQAAAYCDWAGKRLPTEPEWEYAARGDDRRRFPWGDARPTPARLNVCGAECRLYGANRGRVWPAMYESEDGFPVTAPVGSFPDGRSPFGLHDMEGNVREWTASPYCPYPDASCGNELEYVIRGAGWANHFEMNVEVTTREAIGKTEALEQLGFRCAR